MDAASPDNASLDPSVTTDTRGEEEGASGDHDEGADGDESGKLLYNVTKGRYVVVRKWVQSPKWGFP